MKTHLKSLIFLILIILTTIDCKKKEMVLSENPCILISVDTLRADHLSCYGYKKIKTPNIDSFSKDSVLFENVVSVSPLTLPSHISMLSGLYPFEHGVRDNIGFSQSPEIKTLPLFFKEMGFKTAGIVSAFVLRKETGISNGFDFFDDKMEGKLGKLSMGEVQRDGMKSLKVAKEWLSSLETEKFFLFLHLYEPHSPYEPPEPYRTKYKSNLYDGEVVYVDYLLGTFFEFLKKKNIYRKSLIIFTSDHGEGLGEHGELEHGVFLYNTTLSVPLIMKLPDNELKGKRIKEPVSIVDIYPTVLELYKKSFSIKYGKSLLQSVKDMEEKRFLYSETFYPRYHFGWSELRSIRWNNFKLVKAPRPEMFDLESDPREERNIFAKDDELFQYLNSALSALLEGDNPSKPKEVDSETMEKLHALGYVGILKLEMEEKRNLPDPKDRHYLLSYLGKATALSRLGKEEEAIKIFQKVLEKDKNMIDAWSLMARSYTKLKKYEEAIECYKEALKLNPRNPMIIFHIAKLLDSVGDWKRALEYLDLALSIDPHMERVYALKGKIYFYLNNFKRAMEFVEIALSKNPALPLPHYIKGLIKLKEGDEEEAEREFEIASRNEEEGSFHSLHFNLGLFKYRKGDYKGAMEEYEKELKYYPDNYMARTNLALLQRKFGLFEESLRNFEILIDYWKDSPQPYIFLVETYAGLGNIEMASYWAKMGIKIFPENETLKRLIKKIEKRLDERGGIR